MNYTEVIFSIQPRSTETEILIALLSQIGYESFEESDSGLKAYIPEHLFSSRELEELSIINSGEFNITYQHSNIQCQNWNEVWESSFKPVLIGDAVFVRAPFHEADNSVKYEIIIEPKMSFGTAHHETTSMMIELMLKENFSGMHVLDMGCGTGILSILAEMLGAKTIIAIDNDEWAYQNALENIQKNNCRKITVVKNDAGFLKNELFDFVLANINRNVLLEDMQIYADHLAENGIALLSGFYACDLSSIEQSANAAGMKLIHSSVSNEWTAVRLIKS